MKVFEQLSKEMSVFAQNNHRDYDKMQKFFLYELELRCLAKREIAELCKEIEPDNKEVRDD